MDVFDDRVILFVGSLIIGAFGVHVGALVVTRTDDFGKALITALVGAVIWSLASYLFLGVPYVGPALTLAAYLLIVKWRYGTTWPESVGIALLAWIVGLGVLSVLSTVGLGSLDALGIPRL